MKLSVTQICSLIVMIVSIGCNQASESKPVVSRATDTNIVAFASGAGKQSNVLDGSPVMVSKDYGVSWESISVNLPNEVQVSFLQQRGAEIVLASDNMGVFISSAKRTMWKAISGDLPGKKINALHISENKIYAGVYRKGIYQTSNEGATWEALNYNLPNLNVQSILKLNNQLLVGTDDGIFLLSENAKKWAATDVEAQVLSIYEFDGKIIGGTSQGTLISKDLGKSWNWIRREGAVHYTHNIGQRIVELQLNGDVIYSDDWGESWNTTQYQPREGSYVYEIIRAEEYQLISNNYGIHRSDDRGKSWEHIYGSETIAFFDLLLIDQLVYGGTRYWDEYRKRN